MRGSLSGQARVQAQIVALCVKSATSLDFKITKIPYKILRNVKTFVLFPTVMLHFGGVRHRLNPTRNQHRARNLLRR